jgi:hypothetical protein
VRNLRFKDQSEFDAYLQRLKSPGTVATDTSTKRGPKYHNVKTTSADGIVHDAKGESQRWEELRLRERAGEIRNLRRQVVYALVVNGHLITTYKADFVYEDGAATVVEDRKSPRTRTLESFRHKVKLMQACHNIQVREV